MNYLVKWYNVIENVDSPQEAAKRAASDIINGESLGFQVREMKNLGIEVTIDLSEDIDNPDDGSTIIITDKNQIQQEEFKARGHVYGEYWGGGKGVYAAKILTGTSMEEIIKAAKEGVDKNSLDDGMGFKEILGALLEVTKTKSIEIDGEVYYNTSTELIVVGDLTKERIEFLHKIYEMSQI